MTLFFGVGTGRCGTMTLANLLNMEDQSVCLHEGKIRRGIESGEQWLPFLTLQNLVAYHQPEQALSIFRSARQEMLLLADNNELANFGDIAYNYAPFVGSIPSVFPDAKLIVMMRDGRDFVRSVYTSENPDPTPVGWPDERPLSKTERFISLGRLRPMEGSALYYQWQSFNPVQKNAWLWAETNRLILEGMKAWSSDNVLLLWFEDFFQDPLRHYQHVREFLGITGEMTLAAIEALQRPINAREQFMLPLWQEWDSQTMDCFMKYAGSMMEELGYLSQAGQPVEESRLVAGRHQ